MTIVASVRKYFDRDNHIDEILSTSRSMDEAYRKFGNVLKYFIATRDKKGPKDANYQYGLGYIQDLVVSALSQKRLQNNVLNNGYVTHSFNGYNLKMVKKYGLGSNKTYNPALANDLDVMCGVFGESRYTEDQGKGSDETYYTAPGAKSFHYACGYSPERLWCGPLAQDRGNALPVIVGESKVDYAKRVLASKAERLRTSISAEDIEVGLRAGNSVIEKLCSKKPVIAFIPIKSKHYTLNACHSSTRHYQGGNYPKLLDTIKAGTGSYREDNPLSFFTEDTHSIEQNNLGNLVHTGIIPAKDLEFIEVEDGFSLMQRRAMLKGIKPGEKIDFFSGERYIEKETKIEPVSKEQIQEEKNNIGIGKENYVSDVHYKKSTNLIENELNIDQEELGKFQQYK